MGTSTGITATEIKLLAIHKSPVLRLERICEDHLGMSYDRAKRLAAVNSLPVPAYRLSESQKAPLMVSTKDLAEYIDRKDQLANTSWRHSQV